MGSEDFVSEEPISVEVSGRKFKIRELNGEESDNISNQYIKVDGDSGNVLLDVALRNKLILGACVVDAPYDKDGVEFSKLSKDDKIKILNKLKPGIRSPLLKEIFKVNSVESGVSKN